MRLKSGAGVEMSEAASLPNHEAGTREFSGKSSKRQSIQIPADLPDQIRELNRQQAEILDVVTRVLHLVERRAGPRDSADVALLLAIVDAIGARDFTCTALKAHATVDLALSAALEASDITNARELGWLCRRLDGVDAGGLRLERVGESRDGIVWRVRVSESQTRVG